MENARELLRGNFTHHFEFLRERLTALGYQVTAEIHFLDKFGLPQRRERALVIAAHRHFAVHTLEEFWQGWKVRREATTVRRAIAGIPRIKAGEVDPQDRWHASPNLGETALKRIRAIPRNGGSWIDIIDHPNASELLTPAMKRYIEKGDFGSHPDVYGRLCWDRPAVTVKRECGHTGNGRYAHPEQDRLCSVREMAILQGFPNTYRFAGSSLSNMYRHIGDAVPPLISYQIAHVCEWILSGSKPEIQSAIMPDTRLTASDVLSEAHQYSLPLAS
jgi:DNA (cytosine-5)-methyltransferase 1